MPGGQPNPNDGGLKNLSDNYDCYQNRIFTVTNGEVSAYAGNYLCPTSDYPGYVPFRHWLDSGRNEPGPGDPIPNNLVPYIRLYPYADTTNPGGVYIMAICSLDRGYPVEPRDCKYDAFKVKKQMTISFFLDGMKFLDVDGDGTPNGYTEPGLAGWTPLSPEEQAAGRQAIERAGALGGGNDVERGLIAALSAYFADPTAGASAAIGTREAGQSCHGLTGGADHAARALAYEKAMERLFAEHPRDVEVASFYALALLATHPPTDASLKNPKRATRILEPFHAANPNHPGVTHYLIHGYDYPKVAARGLQAAREYAAIAPWVPHALHMPSHIFTRLGMWDDVIASNQASADAARQYAASHNPEAASSEELHALDYMIYGYLQRGDDGARRRPWPQPRPCA